MSVEIRLIGAPTATRDGEPVELRGNKGWLLAAVALLTAQPVPRTRLMQLLFADAADPAGALRWNLSHLRKMLGVRLDGDPVRVDVGPDVRIDVLSLRDGDADQVVGRSGLDGELLAGIDTSGSVELEMWLEDERRHVRHLVADVLREAALARLGRGDSAGAVELARRVHLAAPLDENAVALLVRCLRADRRPAEANQVASRTVERLRDELGVEPTATLWSALASPPGGERRATGRGVVFAQLETGRAAVSAGAVDAGVGALRSATVAARALGDGQLLAAALVELGSALIHAVRGTDQDGLALLHEALPLAHEHGASDVATMAMREIGYVDMLRARYDRSLHWLGRAREAAIEDLEQEAWATAYQGVVRADIGDTDRARDDFDASSEAAASCGDGRLGAFVRSFRGRLALTEHDPDAAIAELQQACDVARRLSWTSFLGFPESMLADALRLRGQLEDARELGERALAVSEQVADPCWESLALRSLGLISVDEGHVRQGVELLTEAPSRCRRLPDTYIWIEAFGLDALAAVVVRHGLPVAHAVVDELNDTVTSHGMAPLRRHVEYYRRGEIPSAP